MNAKVPCTEENTKSHKCNICGSVFSRKYSLVAHVADVHHKWKLKKCDDCDSTFHSKKCLERHKYKVHLKKPRDRGKKNETYFLL